MSYHDYPLRVEHNDPKGDLKIGSKIDTILGECIIFGYYSGDTYLVRFTSWTDEIIENMGGEENAFVILSRDQMKGGKYYASS